MNWYIVWDYHQQPILFWALLILPLLFSVLGLFLLIRSESAMMRGTSCTMLLVGGLVFLIPAISTVSSYVTVRQAISAGTYQVTEGYVTNFTAATTDRVDGMTGGESFAVGGTRFAFHPAMPNGIFLSRTVAAGGPVRDGRYVRISHLNGNIFRVEARR